MSTPSAAAPEGVALGVAGVSKAFRGTQALRKASVRLLAREIHGIVGENGSGKSTLMKIVAGVYSADEGVITVGTESLPAADMNAIRSRELGISVVHQDAPVFPNLSVAENLHIGRGFPTQMGWIQRRQARARAAELLDRFHIPARPGQLVGEVGPAVRAMLSIAREMQDREHASSGVLLLDEPTAGLNEAEVELLLKAIRRYAEEGQAIALVSHRLDEILDACDRVTVIRDGRTVATKERAELDRRELIDLMVGVAGQEEYEHAEADRAEEEGAAPVRLRVTELCAGPLRDVSLEVREGEIVGLTGLLGSGAAEILRAIYGSVPIESGAIEVDGHALREGGVREAIAHGLGYVPADRGSEAIFGLMSLGENLAVGELGQYWNVGRLDRRREREDARELVRRFGIQPEDLDMPVVNLSGGNQQKVVIARALRRGGTGVLLEEPTQGVDVRARAQIHHAIRSAADDGMAVLVSSSDADELVRICDRVVVFVKGRLIAQLRGEEINRDRVRVLVHRKEEPRTAIETNVSGGNG